MTPDLNHVASLRRALGALEREKQVLAAHGADAVSAQLAIDDVRELLEWVQAEARLGVAS